jgi:ABC-2 type transport system permease protein
MSTQFDDMLKSPSETGAAPARFVRTRPFYWSLRRELFEHRAIYLAPVAGAALALFGVVISSWKIPGRVTAAIANHAQGEHLMIPYSFVAMGVIVLSCIVGVLYSLDALHGERRDRSILFWKSLPVSDATTVLSKAAVALLVLPVVMFVVVFAGQLLALAWSSIVVLLSGQNPMDLWSRLDLFFMWFMLVYGFAFLALWYAPVVGWFLLVGGWAKRLPILWAIAPFIGGSIIERIAFNSQHFYRFWQHRLAGGFSQAFFTIKTGKPVPVDGMADLDLSRSYGNPEMWLGLLVAALFIFAAIRLRRSRSPL